MEKTGVVEPEGAAVGLQGEQLVAAHDDHLPFVPCQREGNVGVQPVRLVVVAEFQPVGQNVAGEYFVHAAAFCADEESVVGSFEHVHRGIAAEALLAVGLLAVEPELHLLDVARRWNLSDQQSIGGGCQQRVVVGDVQETYLLRHVLGQVGETGYRNGAGGGLPFLAGEAPQSAVHSGNPESSLAVFFQVVDVVAGQRAGEVLHCELPAFGLAQAKEAVGLAAHPVCAVGSLRDAIDGGAEGDGCLREVAAGRDIAQQLVAAVENA